MHQNKLSFYKENFLKKLSKFIKKGDSLYIETDLSKFINIFKDEIRKKDFVDFYLNIFKKLIGKNGTIICPSFSYSWGQDKKKKIFDINNTQGKTGVFSEYLRQQRGSKRTLDPMFSFISIGKKKSYFTKTSNDSFGKNSVFEKMHEKNTKLVSFGLNKFDPTFVHYVEQFFDQNIKKIKYRKRLKFKGIIKIKKKKKTQIHYSFMRPKNSKRIYSEIKIKKNLMKKKFLKQLIINKGLIQIVSCKNFFNEGILGMKKDINFFNKIYR